MISSCCDKEASVALHGERREGGSVLLGGHEPGLQEKEASSRTLPGLPDG